MLSGSRNVAVNAYPGANAKKRVGVSGGEKISKRPAASDSARYRNPLASESTSVAPGTGDPNWSTNMSAQDGRGLERHFAFPGAFR